VILGVTGGDHEVEFTAATVAYKARPDAGAGFDQAGRVHVIVAGNRAAH